MKHSTADTVDATPRPTIHIDLIRFSGGSEYSLGAKDRVLFVGPNNAGKSLALREIVSRMSSNPGDNPVTNCITSISVSKSGSTKELAKYLASQGTNDKGHFIINGAALPPGVADFFGFTTMGPLAPIFIKHVTTENRLQASAEVKSIASGEAKSRAQHYLYDSRELMSKISDRFYQAFRQSLIIDYRGGSVIPIHVGPEPELDATEERISDSYVAKVRALPRLSTQGDGMRGYAGILFEGIVLKHDVVLVDEPEAFLHPPQMRRLASALVEESNGQLFVSTHSSDILRGFLDVKSHDVRIIRLQRVGDVNLAKETNPTDLRALWDNPDLKYSNALDAIFHEQCILCEDDSDCRFYNAVFDLIEEEQSTPDTIFVPCGGKHSMSKLAYALTALGVPTKIVVDIDAIAEKSSIKKMVESLGGTWSHFEKDWKILDSDVRKGIPPLDNEQIKARVVKLVTEAARDELPKSAIEEALKQDKPWNAVKKGGKGMLPRGAAFEAFNRLDSALRKLGIFLVPVGEVEGFVPSMGLHGPAFVSKVMNSLDMSGDELSAAREFVRSIAR